MRGAAIIALAALSLAGAGAQAAEKKERWAPKSVADKAQFVMDPAKAYILLEADQMVSVTLMKRPSAAEAEADRAERAEELAKVRQRWAKNLATWERARAAYARTKSGTPPGPRPQEPTEESFAWPAYEFRHVVSVGPEYRFFKKGVSLYLQEVQPGEYLYYGNVLVNPNGGVAGTCACLGTVSFAADAGRVTMLGKISMPFVEAMKLPKEQRPKDAFGLPEGTTTLRLLPTTPAARDTRIPADRIVAASLRPLPRVPNWYGIEVDRLMPIDGVFRYDRDRIVDLTAGGGERTAEAGSGPVAR